MNDWYDFLEEEISEKFGIDFLNNDEQSDKLSEISENLCDALVAMAEYESYGTPSQIGYGKPHDDEKDNLRNEIDKLYEYINAKGFSVSYENGHIYEHGMRNIGGTVSASYKDKIV